MKRKNHTNKNQNKLRSREKNDIIDTSETEKRMDQKFSRIRFNSKFECAQTKCFPKLNVCFVLVSFLSN